MRRPTGFNWKNMKFVFDEQVKREDCTDCNTEQNPEVKDYDPTDLNSDLGEEEEMIQIDPPVLVIPMQ